MIQIINLFIDHLLVKLLGIPLSSISANDMDKSSAEYN